MRKKSTIGYTFFSLAFSVIFLWYLYTCIADLMLHALFVIASGTMSYNIFMMLSECRGYLWDRRIAYGSILTSFVLVFVVCIWSPQLFESIELFNGGIAYVSVKWLGNDFHCVSNGREVEVMRGSIRDIYLTRQGDGKRLLSEHFQEIAEEELVYQSDQDDFFLVDKEGKAVVRAYRRPKNGYDIWDVRADDRYRYKTIWGGVPKIRDPLTDLYNRIR